MAENKDLEGYKISTMEDEEDYFDNVEMELDYSISITEGSMELGKDNIKEQKKYMRDSHGDMDDEEFLQNMQSVNNDEASEELRSAWRCMSTRRRCRTLANLYSNIKMTKSISRYMWV